MMPLDQQQRYPQRHQRLQRRASQCHFVFVLLLACSWLLSSSVVQAVLTEDDIIDKELTWAAMARKVQNGFHLGAPDTEGASKTRNDDSDNDHDFDWTEDDYDWTQQQRQQDRIQLRLQQQEQPRQRQQLRSRQQQNVEMPSNRANLRVQLDESLSR
jgi:hypothetical protein